MEKANILENVTLNIHRSKRKTLSIYIERDGSVTVRAPKQLSQPDLETAIQSKEYLIHKHLATWKELNSSKVSREFVAGESFMYLGRNYLLDFVEAQSKPLLLKNGRFLMRRQDISKGKNYFIQFYKEKGLPRIQQRTWHYQKQMGVQPKDIKIMELQNRWASCMPNGNLNFHWKCLMAPLSVIDYVIVHELAHLVHANHGPDFWNLVDKVLPRYDRAIGWLREYGAGMDL